MVTPIIIPIIIVSIAGLSGYLIYRFLIYDLLCKRSVDETLKKYRIKKTPFQIIKEYHSHKGERISDKEINALERRYRQREPQQFLAMYDAIRDKKETEKE